MEIPYRKISAAVLSGRDEDRHLEHKETIKYDIRTKQANPALLDSVIDRVCGFWNGGGGTVLVGVQDRTGAVIGLDRDLILFKDLDSMVLHVTNKINEDVPSISAFVRVTVEKVRDKDILRIDTPRGNHPVFRKGRFLLRKNNATFDAKPEEVAPYIASRFPGFYADSGTEIDDTGTELDYDPRKALWRRADTDPNNFGHWVTTEERLVELNNRLGAWFVSGEQLPEIFAEACRRLSSKYEGNPFPWETDYFGLLRSFEEALDDFDNIYVQLSQKAVDPDDEDG